MPDVKLSLITLFVAVRLVLLEIHLRNVIGKKVRNYEFNNTIHLLALKASNYYTLLLLLV